MATSGQRGGGKGADRSRGSGKKDVYRPLKEPARKIDDKSTIRDRAYGQLNEDSLAGHEDTGGRDDED